MFHKNNTSNISNPFIQNSINEDILKPNIFLGLGLRPQHYPFIFEHLPKIDWFEAISENFMDTGGKPLRNLAKVKEHYPIALHGVALSIGTIDPLNSEYLKKLKNLIDWVKPICVSDHLCWTGIAHQNTHDLLPLPYTEESLKHLTQRINEVQDYLQRPIALENPSAYLSFKHSTMNEAEFLAQLVSQTQCNLLLDINNVYVTSFNHQLNPYEYIDQLPLNAVSQIHLAGHRHYGNHIIDTHDSPVIQEVWDLFDYVGQKYALSHLPFPKTMVEWDDNIPDFSVVYDEVQKVRPIIEHIYQQEKVQSLESQTLQLQTLQPQNNLIDKNILAHQPQTNVNYFSLQETQTLLQQGILPTQLSSGPKNEKVSITSNILEYLIPKNDFSVDEQLGVYQNAYRSRLYEVVVQDYPVLQHLLGGEYFSELLHEFINQTTSVHFNIARYSYDLPDFLEQQLSNEQQMALELCQLEGTIIQLMDASESQVLTSADLAQFSPEKLLNSPLKLRDALKIHTFKFPVNDYYNQYYAQKNNDLNINNKQYNDEKRLTDLNYLLVFSHEDVIWRMELEKQEYDILQKIHHGASITEALDGIVLEDENIISFWFNRWISNGVLAYNFDDLRE